jgi:tetratricopeptide (TPR) repeat protein
MTKNWKLTLVLMASSICYSTANAQTIGDAKKAEDQENYDSAIRTYRKLLAGNTDDNIFFSLGNAYLQNEKVDSANYYFNEGLARNKKSAINMVGLGKAKLMKNDVAGAEQHFNEALKLTRSKDTNVLNEIARAYLEANKDLDKAIVYLQASQKRDNKNPETHLILGDIYLEQNKGGDAMNNYEQALRLNPNQAKAQVRRGQLFIRSRNANEAHTALQEAIKIDPSYAPAYREMGDLYLLTHKYDEAADMYRKNIQLAGTSGLMQYKLATALYSGKKFDEAHQQIQQALAADPNNVGMQRLQAYTYYEAGLNQEQMQDGDKEKAQEYHNRALELMTRYFQQVNQEKFITDDYRYYGNMLAKAGRDDEAFAMLNKAIELDKENAGPLYETMALINYRNKEYGKAAENYQKKIDATQGTIPLADIYRLADAHYWDKNYQKSDSLFAMITEQQPNYPEAHIARARANFFIDSADGTEEGLAVPHYEKYIELTEANKTNPNYREKVIEAHSFLGAFYTDKKNKEKATAHWQAVLELDPTNEAATQATDANKPSSSRRPATRR